jgi:hypothetical protein
MFPAVVPGIAVASAEAPAEAAAVAVAGLVEDCAGAVEDGAGPEAEDAGAAEDGEAAAVDVGDEDDGWPAEQPATARAGTARAARAAQALAILIVPCSLLVVASGDLAAQHAPPALQHCSTGAASLGCFRHSLACSRIIHFKAAQKGSSQGVPAAPVSGRR